MDSLDFKVLVLLSILVAVGVVNALGISDSVSHNSQSFGELETGISNTVQTWGRFAGREFFSFFSKSNKARNLMMGAESVELFEPSIKREGNWVGAPSVLKTEDAFYMYYRERNYFLRGNKGVLVKRNGSKGFEKIWG